MTNCLCQVTVSLGPANQASLVHFSRIIVVLWFSVVLVTVMVYVNPLQVTIFIISKECLYVSMKPFSNKFLMKNNIDLTI